MIDIQTLLFASVTARIGFILIFVISSFKSEARVAFRYWTASIFGSTIGLLLIYGDRDYPYFSAGRGTLIYLIIGLSLSCVWAGIRCFFDRPVSLPSFVAMSVVPGLLYGSSHILGAKPDIVVLVTIAPLICITAIGCYSVLVQRSRGYLPSQLMVGVALGAYSFVLTLSFVLVVARLATTNTAPSQAATDIGLALFFEQFMSVLTYVGIISMSLEDAQRKLKIIATSDPLTGLCNRRGVQEQASIRLKIAQRTGRPMVVMIADIDHFKSINDQYGHDIGDIVLREVARRVSSYFRHGNEIIGRWGGEEFLIVMSDVACSDGIREANKLCRIIGAEPLDIGVQSIAVTASIGIAMIDPNLPLEQAVSRADNALYKAKAKGRNRVCSDDAGNEGLLPVRTGQRLERLPTNIAV